MNEYDSEKRREEALRLAQSAEAANGYVGHDVTVKIARALIALAAELRERKEEIERLSHFIAGLGWHDFGTHWELVEAGVAPPGDDDE